MINFENENVWIVALKKSIAKRLIKRNYRDMQLIQDICDLNEKEIDNLLKVQSSFIKQYENI